MSTRCLCVYSTAAILVAGLTVTALADAPRVLPEGKVPNDRRLEKIKNLDAYFPFQVPASREAWEKRAEYLRRQLLLSQGLWPMPTKTPLNAVVHGKLDRGDYTVEKVYLESYPGHFVTGSLYRPKPATPQSATVRRPAVLCPHGHWPNGRFMDRDAAAAKAEIDSVQERYEAAARSPLQARCVHLARLGCVVFHYDMLGVADSVQIAHRPGVRKEMNTTENWGFFSPQAELHLQSMMGLQTYNSIRALDWIISLPDVDASRIGVTGASGGGTQTFMLTAVDPRPAAAFPAVMVSTAMQGGCTCENAPFQRLGTGNIEIAALFAPKPQGMTAADDWTKEMTYKGFPELQQLYGLLGKKENVFLNANVQYPHNYNATSRAAMYVWFNKHLGLGQPAAKLIERDFTPLTREEMSVWDSEHPKPKSGDEYERSLLKYLTQDSEKQIAALSPSADSSPEARREFRRVLGGAWDMLISRHVPPASALEWQEPVKNDRGEYFEIAGLLRNKPAGEEIPVLSLRPKKWNKQVVVWVHEQGKAGLYGSDGAPTPAVKKLLAGGTLVVGIDLFGQGEYVKDGKPIEHQRLDIRGGQPWQQYAGYTYGYNQSLFAQRTSDILTVISFIRGHEGEKKPEKVHLIGLDGPAGAWAAAARAQAGRRIDRAAIGTAGFRFARLTAIDDVNFLPGSVKYGDLPTLLALSAPGELWISGESELPSIVSAAYRAAGKGDAVKLADGPGAKSAEAAVEWLLADAGGGDVKSSIRTAIRLLAEKEHLKFLQAFVVPDDLKKITKEVRLEDMAKEFGKEKAEALLAALRSIGDQKPEVNTDSTVATFSLEKPVVESLKTITFQKIEGQWYLRNR